MKKFKKLALVAMSLTLLTSCSIGGNDKTKVKDTVQKQPSQGPSQGITVNKIPYEEVNILDLKPNIKAHFDSAQAYKGYISYKHEDGYWYIGIYSGKKNTGGYKIKVLYVEDIEGKTVITVEETSPKSSDFVTQAITYPYTLIKTKRVVGPIIVQNTKFEQFKDISKEGAAL